MKKEKATQNEKKTMQNVKRRPSALLKKVSSDSISQFNNYSQTYIERFNSVKNFEQFLISQQDTITALFDLGCSFEEVVNLLACCNIQVSKGQLEQCLEYVGNEKNVYSLDTFCNELQREKQKQDAAKKVAQELKNDFSGASSTPSSGFYVAPDPLSEE